MVTVLRQPEVERARTRDRSIVSDINHRVTLMVSLVAVAVVAVNYLFAVQSERRQIDEKADEVIATMSEAFRVPFWDFELSNAMELATVFSKGDWVSYIRIKDGNGQPIAGIGMRDEAAVFRTADIKSGDTLMASIAVGLTTAPLHQKVQDLLRSSVFLLIAMIAALSLFNRYFVRRSLQRPVNVLLERIQQITDKRYATPQSPVQHHEVRAILAQFDVMAQKIEQREQGLREANAQLQSAEVALTAHRDRLEETVAERTHELREEIKIRESTEAQLHIAKTAADVANRAKSEFLAQMSHELRTPLNGILGYAQILHKQVGLAKQHYDGLDTIRQCGEHLLSLINEILDLAKIEAGKMELDRRVFSLPHLVQNIEAIFQQRTVEKGLRFSLVPEAMPEAVYGDERKLRQILINLLGNAVKFTESGEIVLRLTATGQTVRFEVRDTGPGIPPERMNDLFQPFTQLHDGTKPKEGSGLGLAISERLVKLMGGELKVASTLGEGSCFWFELALPAATEAVVTAPRTEQTIIGYHGPKRRVLITDDKAINRAVLVGLLDPLGFACSEAEDGEDCLQQVHHTPPDIILMDIVMPRLDGLEAARRLRRAPESRDIPIVAMSASVFAKDKQLCLENGCVDFLAKPVIVEDLLESLARFLKLEWVYDTAKAEASLPPPSGGEGKIEQLPETIAQALWEAARKGHGKGVIEQVKALDALGSPYASSAGQLRELARQFRFEDICRYVEPFLSSRESAGEGS